MSGIEERVASLEAKYDAINKRLDKVDEMQEEINKQNVNLTELVGELKLMNLSLRTSQDTIKDHEDRITEIEQKPMNKAEQRRSIIFSAIVSALAMSVATFLITYFSMR